MAEIKSAFELAMERTKKIVISEEERETFRQKEILQKAMSLFHRYRDGHLPLNELLREIDKMEEKTRVKVKEVLLSRWIDSLSLHEEHERFIEGIESMKGKSLGDVEEQFERLISQYETEKEKARSEVALQLTEGLKRDGIYGDAVDPCLETSGNYRELREAADRKFSQKIEEMKEALRKS
jgi:hypothetical protein